MRVPFTRTFGKQPPGPDLMANERPLVRMKPMQVEMPAHGAPTDGDELDAIERAQAEDRDAFLADRKAHERAGADALDVATKGLRQTKG
jgi:hypothetical protein